MKKEYFYIDYNPKLPQSFLARVLRAVKITFGLDLLKGLMLTLKQFFSKKVTIQYPLEIMPTSPRYRAVHRLQRLLESENERCIGCGLCEKICTSNCIRILTNVDENGRKGIVDYSINFGRCIYCGLCAEVCPELAIVHGERTENASFARAHYSVKEYLLDSSAPLQEYEGYGSVSIDCDERLGFTPLVKNTTLDSAQSQSTQSQSAQSPQTSQSAPQPTQGESHA
ncbi:NADH-quinone oxidoreductase subunit NuoI [Helicobacter sp. MIT 00-7814]|nr:MULTISPECIES: NADH-quinone oxidoreductase subunit NuoI [unclassified Helicobacter]RDU53923.1 NADH-quinone oxidoreductase subunit NuoI [Helicobacter sp. MIT 00-7814]RDU57053.1 NADH-quinone oxidoreductase subunit NuoI [Helicobacter sp. MIT 99-10781]